MILIQHDKGFLNATMISNYEVGRYSTDRWAIIAHTAPTCDQSSRSYIIAVFDDRPQAIRGLWYLAEVLGQGQVKVIVESEIVGSTML